MRPRALVTLERQIVQCRACPRLVAWRERVAQDKVARFEQHPYWGKPVMGFGDPEARILFVGLAPGAHGANRTGRMFTGDRSGDFLFAAMHRAGLANQATSVSRDDGLELRDAYIVAAIRCAPPANRPAPDEIGRCAHFLDDEIDLLPRVRVFLALGAIAWRACLDHLWRTAGSPRLARKTPSFAHGALLTVSPARGGQTRVLLGSFHVSQQNTQTGKLTKEMFDHVLSRAKDLAEPAAVATTKR